MLIRPGLVVLSVLGFFISLYFTLVTFRLMKPDQRFIPKVCRIRGDLCLSIVDSPQARLFGVPNSLLGILYYAAVMASALFSAPSSPVMYNLLVVASVGTILTGLYLAYSLLVVLKVPCVLCFTGHVINAVILLLLILDPAD